MTAFCKQKPGKKKTVFHYLFKGYMYSTILILFFYGFFHLMYGEFVFQTVSKFDGSYWFGRAVLDLVLGFGMFFWLKDKKVMNDG